METEFMFEDELRQRVADLEADNKRLHKKLADAYSEVATAWKRAERLREALESFVCNSSVQVNYPVECERAEAVIAKVRGTQGG